MIKENKVEFDNMNITKWREEGFFGKGSTVVILDVGGMPLARHNIIEPFRVKGKDEKNGHKTHVCGVVREMLPEATIVAFHWSGDFKDEIIAWIEEHQNEIDVINCSFEGRGSAFERLKDLKRFDIPIMGGTGNESEPKGINTVSLDFITGIGAWGSVYDRLATFSNYGLYLDFVAYTGISYQTNKGSYLFHGTSCSSPVAACLIALGNENRRRQGLKKMTRQEAFEFQLEHVDDKLTPGRDFESGYGLVRLPSEIPVYEQPKKIEVDGLKINQKFIKQNFVKGRKNQPIQYIVIHDTWNYAASATAENHFRYFNSAYRGASAHYFIDQTQILQVVRDEDTAWHVGDGKNKFGITNENAIGVEICVNDGNYDKEINDTIQLTAYLMKKHGIPLSNVVRHYDASRKICPGMMSGNNWFLWNKFKFDLEAFIKKGKGNVEVDKPVEIIYEGKEIVIDGVFKNDRNYVSIRDLSELLGFTVGYDVHTKKVLISK